MRRCHTGDASTFIQTILDYISDLYSLPRAYRFTLAKIKFTLGNMEFTLDNMEFPLDNMTPVLQFKLFE